MIKGELLTEITETMGKFNYSNGQGDQRTQEKRNKDNAVYNNIQCNNSWCRGPHKAKDCRKCRHCLEKVDHKPNDCPKKPPPTCKTCGEDGHMQNDCPKSQNQKACHNCGGTDHLQADCEKPKVKKDWSTYRCTYCKELGHADPKRCEKKLPEKTTEETDEGVDGSGGQGDDGDSSSHNELVDESDDIDEEWTMVTGRKKTGK